MSCILLLRSDFRGNWAEASQKLDRARHWLLLSYHPECWVSTLAPAHDKPPKSLPLWERKPCHLPSTCECLKVGQGYCPTKTQDRDCLHTLGLPQITGRAHIFLHVYREGHFLPSPLHHHWRSHSLRRSYSKWAAPKNLELKCIKFYLSSNPQFALDGASRTQKVLPDIY